MPYLLLRLSVTSRYSPLIHWLSRPTGWAYPYASGGVRLKEENVPREARVASQHRTLPDFVTLPQAIGVSPAFRKIVEELEPGVHQFFPVTLCARSGELAHRQYDLFNIVGKVDAVIEEKSDVKRIRSDLGSMVLHYTRAEPHLTLDAKLIVSRHVWRGDKDLHNQIFFSDELGERVARLNMKKLDLIKVDQI